MKQRLENPAIGVAERSLLLSHVYGDKFSIDFWTLAISRLNSLRHILNKDDSTAPIIMEGEEDGGIIFNCPILLLIQVLLHIAV